MQKDILTLADQHFLTDANSLQPLLDRVDEANIVMLGEATHGTHEFYTWRSAITRKLITEKGFTAIAVEGDWPDCYRINRWIKGYEKEGSARDVLSAFRRWPTWMWANWEISALMEWLRDHNNGRSADKRVGFYGLDVYSLWESLEAITGYLKKEDRNASALAEHALRCFSGYSRSEQQYAMNAILSPCRDEVVNLLKELRLKAPTYDHDPEAALNVLQNAHIAVAAEKYYRNMVAFDEDTWNIRDRHMMDTLQRLRDAQPGVKVIVWAHNTHIGDARYTDMKHSKQYNIGQLARQENSEAGTVLVGFGTYQGQVIAGAGWGMPMQEMQLPPARYGSLEAVLHEQSPHTRLLVFDRDEKVEDHELRHRAVGVVYDSDNELWNYVPSVVNRRYDAFVYIDQTSALHPLPVKPDEKQVPETYPFEF